MEDIEQKRLTNLHENRSGGDGLIVLAQSQQVRSVSYQDWKRLDAYETNARQGQGKLREKIVRYWSNAPTVLKIEQLVRPVWFLWVDIGLKLFLCLCTPNDDAIEIKD